MVDQPRPIWLTGKQHNELARIYALQPPAVITEILAAWAAAPADATYIAERGILQTFPDLRSVRVSLSMDSSELAATICARNVLRALGMPDA